MSTFILKVYIPWKYVIMGLSDGGERIKDRIRL